MITRSKVGRTIKNDRKTLRVVRQKEQDDKDFKKLKSPAKNKRIAKKGDKDKIKQKEEIFDTIQQENNHKSIKEVFPCSQKKTHKKADRSGIQSELGDQFSVVSVRDIDLSTVEMLIGAPNNPGDEKNFIIKRNRNNSISLQTLVGACYQQVFLEQEIDISKKYTLQFTVSQFEGNQFFIGLMPKGQVLSWIMYSGFCGFFFKRFASSSPEFDCSKVLKGSLFGDEVHSGDSFEMRFCIKDQILEFSTIPGYENVVSKLDNEQFDISSKGSYVITICTYKNVGITVNSLLESSFFPSYCD